MLCRRHADLTIIEHHPGGGQYDCLGLIFGSCERSCHRSQSRRKHPSASKQGRVAYPGRMPLREIISTWFSSLNEVCRSRGLIRTLPTNRKLLTYRIFRSTRERQLLRSASNGTYALRLRTTSGYGEGPLKELVQDVSWCSPSTRDSYGTHLLGDVGVWVLVGESSRWAEIHGGRSRHPLPAGRTTGGSVPEFQPA